MPLVDLALPVDGKGSSLVSDAPQGRLTPSAKGLHGYGEEGHGQGSGGATVRALLIGLSVLGLLLWGRERRTTTIMSS